jgi:1-phosphofructokinase
MTVMSGVLVFAPSPLVTVTVEDRAGAPELHVHAGGQGVWQARMLAALGTEVHLCAALGGETGRLLEQLIEAEGITVHPVPAASRNGGYVHDRRSEDREEIAAEHAAALDRHELDELYELTLASGLECGTVLLSGPHSEEVVPPSLYRRLAGDLRANDVTVVADLSDQRLEAVVEAGVDLLKVADGELAESGRARSTEPADLVDAMHQLQSDGARAVVVTRAGDPALALSADKEVQLVHSPPLGPMEPRGAGDSLTAGMTACLAKGDPWETALRIGAACGALNVVRHGLGTGGATAVEILARRVGITGFDEDA